MQDAYLLFFILGLTLLMFMWGHYRYDTVALMSLLALVLTGLVPVEHAFSGFGNPAVITVAAVMVISAVLIQAGLVEEILKYIKPFCTSPTSLIGFTCCIAAFLSAFMNNVGALSLIMPVAIQGAINAKLSPSKILMPLSFATILGGMTTKIGTPPNLIISAYKEKLTQVPFTMFAFTPTGLTVAIGGLIFIILLGWRFLPSRRKATGEGSELYQIQDYISEIRIPEDSPVVGMERQQLERFIEGDFSILALIRGRKKKLVVPYDEELQVNDILIIEASHEDLYRLIESGKLELTQGEVISPEILLGKDVSTVEAVVTPGSRIQGRSWQKLRIRSRMGLNLLAVARAGRAIKNRLNHVNFNAGDVLLIQGPSEDLRENVVSLGLVPLAERTINVGFRRSTLIPLTFFIVGILLSALQILPIEVAFTLVVVGLVIVNILPMRKVYQHIDWSIIVLLGALIPLGEALERTGAAKMIGNFLLAMTGSGSILLVLGLLLLITMTVSDLMNNAATAVVMAPIGADLAKLLHTNVDPFLIAVSIGASCSCLTPISHQNNTLVMGPGGYKFFDYLRLGVPLELVVLATALPALYVFWL
ncbi:SLC13 family permease [Legionella jamestowniensis]|uniref:Transporter n=1 Tax=Legionella jamestowniensis TaxID=455 RepID=A0A0W0UI97_9GAMM|nr:SLC13 family permease [Legionella jamestowniensis]KTD07551.1 putative transporter [Legionella jamestowniensis]OCH97680.1 transporter [Legionella jamestowniensis]SFM01649.1 Di-and tricarboxylate transporter [Legionella jamestowniensis DSM 19215]